MSRLLLLTVLSVACLQAFVPTVAAGDERVIPVRGFLCDSATHAMQFADARATGESEEMAKDRVGRAAKAEVCGLYVGVAIIQSEEVKLASGTAYKLTSFRFKQDRHLAWLAERSFAPTATNWDL